MSDEPTYTNPFFSVWAKSQMQMLEAQAPFWKHMADAAAPPGEGSDLVKSAEAVWQKSCNDARDWMMRMAGKNVFATSENGTGQEILQRMMDPGQFLFAGSDEINQTIQKLVEGPEFADIGTLERQGLKATQEWISLREASAEYRMITAEAWRRAFKRFSKANKDDPDIWNEGARALLNRWMEIANDELIATQRTGTFLDAQRKLLRAGVEYRLRERDLVETWCEAHSMPTRSEIDDLHALVYQLRRELRALKKQVAASAGPKPKTKARTSRTSGN
ncbi:poly(R)-hydroxyalkanoic acid synthase subunit PhaE [Sedimentitalea sp. HM32M-2]|uniref:poly(R)-hydroxyalkanoic acid synthase subunit PhaE n=1 Tax=Sedimentitalea sp. HM32M-2 TaxID=3351566 RepID=UPI00363475AF